MALRTETTSGVRGHGPYLLDTDVCVDWLRQKPAVVALLRALSPADLAVATMTVAELRYGALLSRDPDGNLEHVESILESGIGVLPFDREAANCHAEMRLALRQQPVGDRDLVIASTAHANGFAVMTGNRKEFDRIPGLLVEPVPGDRVGAESTGKSGPKPEPRART
ncbi:MAG: type II toxin-antitoxin system VapC family toxin [Gemmatimonadota bacterium]